MITNKATSERPVGKKLWREALIAARFGLVGLTATTVHILVVSVLLSETQLPALLANACAFLTAFGITFTGNYIWTFQMPGEPWKSMRRFLLISACGFCANTVILAILLSAGWFTPILAAIISATVIALTTFLASRLWGFRNASSEIGNSDGP